MSSTPEASQPPTWGDPADQGSVRLSWDGNVHQLFAGELLGRTHTSQLPLADPRVSEFHAMVSVRGAKVRILALRGDVWVNGEKVDDHTLFRGDVVRLVDGIELTVEEVRPPVSRLRLSLDGAPGRRVAGVVSIFGGANPRLKPGWVAQAPCRVWPDGQAWMRSMEGSVHPIASDDRWLADGVEVHAAMEAQPGVLPTSHSPFTSNGLTIRARYDSVHVERTGVEAPLVLSGLSARLLSELVIAGEPIPWREVAGTLWPQLHPDLLRRRWDVELARVRRTLGAANVRRNLIAAGGGRVSLHLEPADTVHDET